MSEQDIRSATRASAAVKRWKAARQVVMPLQQNVPPSQATAALPTTPPVPPASLTQRYPTEAAADRLHRITTARKQAQVVPTAPLKQGQPAAKATASRATAGAHSTELQRPTPQPAKSVVGNVDRTKVPR